MIVYSAFNGYSGGHLALDRADRKVTKMYISEVDKYCNAVTRYHYPDSVFLGDINNVTMYSLMHMKDVDLMIAGSPCQDVSFSGKGKGLIEGERSNLFFTWLKQLKEIKPKYFLLENVRMKKEYQDIISQELGVEPMLIPSSLVSGQKRDRLYWFNWSCELPEDKKIFLKDIVEDGVVDRDKSFCIDANYWKGGNLKSYFVKNRRQLVFDDHRCIQVGIADIKGHDILKRVYAKEGKAPTLNTMNGGNREPKVINGTKRWRALTPKECERLQTLPDDYTMFGDFETDENVNKTNDDYFIKDLSKTQRYKMLGNGFCVDVIAHILRSMPNE